MGVLTSKSTTDCSVRRRASLFLEGPTVCFEAFWMGLSSSSSKSTSVSTSSCHVGKINITLALSNQLNIPLRRRGKALSTSSLSLARASSSWEAWRMSRAVFFAFAFIACSFDSFSSAAFFRVAAISSGARQPGARNKARVVPSSQLMAEVLLDFRRPVLLGVMIWVSGEVRVSVQSVAVPLYVRSRKCRVAPFPFLVG